MSQMLTIQDQLLDLNLETEDGINQDSTAILRLYDALRNWEALGNIAEITLQQDGGNPLLYSYTVERKNTDEILSTWVLADEEDTDPMVTIICTPAWSAEVLEAGDLIRRTSLLAEAAAVAARHLLLELL